MNRTIFMARTRRLCLIERMLFPYLGRCLGVHIKFAKLLYIFCKQLARDRRRSKRMCFSETLCIVSSATLFGTYLCNYSGGVHHSVCWMRRGLKFFGWCARAKVIVRTRVRACVCVRHVPTRRVGLGNALWMLQCGTFPVWMGMWVEWKIVVLAFDGAKVRWFPNEVASIDYD